MGRLPAWYINGSEMPSSDTILNGLTTIANAWRTVAIAWHLALVVTLLAVLMGWRPSTRVAGYLLSSPILSVSAAAWAHDNAFSGAVFVALFLVLVALASRLSPAPVHFVTPSLGIPGVLLVAFGWGYPHFLETDRWTSYAYAAPFGLLPCPTLSAVIGVTLALGALGSRAWAFTLGAAALVYGAIGAFVLGVTLDYVLLAGAVVLLSDSRDPYWARGSAGSSHA
jgi:hypothetical protein